MSAWGLPTTLTVNNVPYSIRTDFRVILDILNAMNDPDLFEPDADDEEKAWVRVHVLMEILFEDPESIPAEDIQEAVNEALEFIDCGMKPEEGRPQPRTMDWEQDAPILIPAINKVVGQEVRAIPYMHWWTFLGAYMEIGDSLFSQVVSIRQKKTKHQKLEKWEQEFYSDNKSIIDLKKKYSQAELEENAKWEEFFEMWGG